ncbi:MAG: 50S ribosomal protein L21 [Dehalococcoidia bacterium]|nr:50S ribosomal protein L21 [Dehalococcoidia bacterium]
MDAVIRSGGKQYRVHEGSVLDVASLVAEPGSRVELRDVLLVSDGDKVTVGAPNVADAVVVAEVVEHGKGRKVINFKFKAKTRYRRKRGHRQGYTRLTVQTIRIGDAPASETTAAPRRRARPQAGAETEPAAIEEPTAVATEAAETAAETPATPRRRRRAGEAESQE